jgi:hypothetical protein
MSWAAVSISTAIGVKFNSAGTDSWRWARVSNRGGPSTAIPHRWRALGRLPGTTFYAVANLSAGVSYFFAGFRGRSWCGFSGQMRSGILAAARGRAMNTWSQPRWEISPRSRIDTCLRSTHAASQWVVASLAAWRHDFVAITKRPPLDPEFARPPTQLARHAAQLRDLDDGLLHPLIPDPKTLSRPYRGS